MSLKHFIGLYGSIIFSFSAQAECPRIADSETLPANFACSLEGQSTTITIGQRLENGVTIYELEKLEHRADGHPHQSAPALNPLGTVWAEVTYKTTCLANLVEIQSEKILTEVPSGTVIRTRFRTTWRLNNKRDLILSTRFEIKDSGQTTPIVGGGEITCTRLNNSVESSSQQP